MSVSAGPDIVESGLVLYLDAANQKSYPGTGTTWFDLSGLGNNGTLTNGPTFSSANGGSIVFDGTNDFIAIADSNSLTSTTALTINFWFKASVFSGGYSSLIGKGVGDSDEEYCLLVHNSFAYFDVGFTNGPYTQPNYTFNTNTWYNLCAVHSRPSTVSSLPLYVNSIALNNSTIGSTISPINNSHPVSIGSRIFNSPNGPFNGNIASVSIYNRVLTEAEIAQNFNATRSRFGI